MNTIRDSEAVSGLAFVSHSLNIYFKKSCFKCPATMDLQRKVLGTSKLAQWSKRLVAKSVEPEFNHRTPSP